MPTPEWAHYVAMATGVIGALTGISGAIMGYVSYKKSNSLKSLDLRVELRKALNVGHARLQQLAKLIEYANKSRQAVASAKGRYQSGMMEKWKQEVEADNNVLKALTQTMPALDKRYDDLNCNTLESMLVDVHRLHVQLDDLIGKYNAAVRADNEDRNDIREDAKTRHAPK